MPGLRTDLKFALRRLWASPGFTLFAIASLALGIGVTTAIYSAVRTLLWPPLGIPKADQFVIVTNGQIRTISVADFDDLGRAQTVFQSIGAELPIRTAAAGSHGTATVFGLAVSADYFSMTGVHPQFGRLLDATDAAAGAPVVVVSDQFWRANLAADPGAIGETIRLGGQPFTIVGVISGGFHGLESDPLPRAIFVPLTALRRDAQALGAPPDETLKRRSYPAVLVFARLKRGVTIDQASAQTMVIGAQIDRVYPSNAGRIHVPRQWIVRSRASTLGGSEALDTIVFMILLGIVTLLLIACTNLANLALARGTARAQEIAVRSALGASRWRLIREQLVESVILAAAGGASALALLTRLLRYWTTDLPLGRGLAMPFEPQIDAAVLTASIGAIGLALVVSGLWPALQSTRSDVRDALGAGHGATAPKWRLHRNIIAWQVCGSVALLLVALFSARIVASSGAGLMSTTKHGNLALAQIEFTLNGKDESRMRELVASILATVRASRAVRSASVSNGLPFGFWPSSDPSTFTTPDHASEPRTSGRWTLTESIAADPQFFSTVGIPIVRGRAFTALDGAGAPLVAVVSEEFARETYRTLDVVGRTIVREGRTAPESFARTPLDVLTIVGVSADDEPWGNGRRKSVIFVPFAQRYQSFAPVTFVVNATDAKAAVAALRASIHRVDPNLSISGAGTGAVLLDGPLFLLRVIAAMAGALGALALVLAMSGLFGVLSHVVAKRTREIGIRLAIGAERADIFRLIVRDGLHPVGKGLLLGLGIGVGTRIAVKAYVVTNVSAVDPWPLVLLPIPFVLAALVACYLPAARASRVDPNVALRDL